MMLWEAIESDHYLERKAERGTIESINIPNPQIYGEYNKDETNKKLILLLQEELNKRFITLENTDFGISGEYNLGVVFFMPVLVNGNQKSQIKMTTTSRDVGIFYLSIVISNKLITVYPEIHYSESNIENSITSHLKREGKDNGKPSKAHRISNYLYEIDIAKVHGEEKEKTYTVSKTEKTEEDFDYEIRTDYRIGSTFKHKKYGSGKVVAVAGGGKGGANGIVDWVEVQYDKPYVKGGKILKTREFKNIVTKAFFGKTRKP